MKKIFFSKDVVLNHKSVILSLVQNLFRFRACPEFISGAGLIQGLIVLISTVFIFSSAAFAFVSGSTGVKGALNATSTMEILLPDDGILNYTTVNIAQSRTVTFKRNKTNTPVYILATGNVTIEGTINVSGANSTNSGPGIGGPGGFNGGYSGSTGIAGGNGLGPGGGGGGPSTTYSYGGGGGYATAGGTQGASNGAGGSTYGNARIVPFIGGSGGGGSAGRTSTSGYGGGGGGGAILIASSGTIDIKNYGSIKADGGEGGLYGGGYSGAGSGGSIRLMASILTGDGTISAKGGSLAYSIKGGEGRIRIEADNAPDFSAGSDPMSTAGAPGSIFITTNVPTLSITTIGGANTPPNPGGSYSQPDILLPSGTPNPVAVHLSATNIPINATVTVTVKPQSGSFPPVNTTLSGTDDSSTAFADVLLSTQYSNVVTASATFELLVAMYHNGEEIKMARVEATMGGKSRTVYITKSGKEIEAEKVLASLMK